MSTAKKKAPRKKKAAAKKAPRPKKAPRQEFPALPPNFPVHPLDPSDPLAGQEFTARVNCHPAQNRKGKIVTRCDRQRVTVVATAAPSAEHPKRKQVIAAQKGVRVAVSDRALSRAMRVQSRQCDQFAEMVMRGAEPPANAYELCPSLPDAVEPVGGDASFDPSKFNGRKRNHHHGHHAAGDPLGVYLPQRLDAWQVQHFKDGTPSRVFRHPHLGWEFSVYPDRVSGGFRAQILAGAYAFSGHSPTAQGARKLLEEVYGALPSASAQDVNATFYRFNHAHTPKDNRAPKGTAPGHTYVPRQPDPWQGVRVIGDDFAGEVRAPMLLGDGAAGHFVGGHLMPRSRAVAGVRREKILRGEIPAPPSRARKAPAHAAPVVVDEGPEIVYEEPETVYEPEVVYAEPEAVYVPPPPPPPVMAPPPRPVAMLPAPAAMAPPSMRVVEPVLSDRDAALKAVMEEELRALGLLPPKANRRPSRAPRYGYFS